MSTQIKMKQEESTAAAVYDVVVVGAGIGGMVAASYCAKFGLKTLLLDKQKVPGGNCTSFKERGILFDTSVYSVTGLGVGGVLHEVFTELDIDFAPHFEEISPGERIMFPGFDIDVCRDVTVFAAELTVRFPDQAAGLVRYFEIISALYAEVRQYGTIAGGTRNVANIIKYGTRTQKSVLDEHFSDDKLKAVLSVGVPHTYSFLHAAAWKMDHHFYGNYYPKGGAIQIARMLIKRFKQSGGVFMNEQDVQKIKVADGLVQSVETADGSQYFCKHVISNADARTTLCEMVGEAHFPAPYLAKLKALKISNSAFCVFVALDKSPAEFGFTAASVYYHPSWDTVALDRAIDNNILPKDNWLLVNFPSLKDPSLVRDGIHAMILMSYVPFNYKHHINWSYGQREQYLAAKREVEEAIIETACGLMPSLRQHIVFTNTSSPMSFVRYTGNPQGATSGFSGKPSERMNAPQNQTPLKNLVLAGQWTFPGSSVPSCAKSGKMAASLARRYLSGLAQRAPQAEDCA